MSSKPRGKTTSRNVPRTPNSKLKPLPNIGRGGKAKDTSANSAQSSKSRQPSSQYGRAGSFCHWPTRRAGSKAFSTSHPSTPRDRESYKDYGRSSDPDFFNKQTPKAPTTNDLDTEYESVIDSIVPNDPKTPWWIFIDQLKNEAKRQDVSLVGKLGFETIINKKSHDTRPDGEENDVADNKESKNIGRSEEIAAGEPAMKSILRSTSSQVDRKSGGGGGESEKWVHSLIEGKPEESLGANEQTTAEVTDSELATTVRDSENIKFGDKAQKCVRWNLEEFKDIDLKENDVDRELSVNIGIIGIEITNRAHSSGNFEEDFNLSCASSRPERAHQQNDISIPEGNISGENVGHASRLRKIRKLHDACLSGDDTQESDLMGKDLDKNSNGIVGKENISGREEFIEQVTDNISFLDGEDDDDEEEGGVPEAVRSMQSLPRDEKLDASARALIRQRHKTQMEEFVRTVNNDELVRSLKDCGFFTYSYDNHARTTFNNNNLKAGKKRGIQRLMVILSSKPWKGGAESWFVG